MFLKGQNYDYLHVGANLKCYTIVILHTLEFRLDGTKINGENEASC